MVLQRDVPARIWGGGVAAGAAVTVTVSGGAGAETQTARAGPSGDWEVDLRVRSATSAPSNITVVSGTQAAALVDVLFGDVWGCHGQVSMGGARNSLCPSERFSFSSSKVPGTHR